MPQRSDQQGAENRPAQAAQASAGGQQAKQALALGGGKQIGEHAPGQRDGQQIEHRQPDVKGSRLPYTVRVAGKHHGKQHQVGNEEPVGPRQDMPTAHGRCQPAEQRQAGQGGDEGAGEQPLQVIDATGNAHGFAHRA